MNNLAPAEYQNVRYYVSQIYILEGAIFGASGTLNVRQAAAFIRNPREMRERRSLYRNSRRELCTMVGVPPGPDLGDGGLSMVV